MFYDMDNNYPYLVSGDGIALHGLGPAYESYGTYGGIGLYVTTIAGINDYGRGVGEIMTPPISTYEWHTVRVEKSRRSLAMSVDGNWQTAILGDEYTANEFNVISGPVTLGEGDSSDTMLHGEMRGFIMDNEVHHLWCDSYY